MKRVILASASPRRKQLLGELLPDFEIIVSNFEEKAVRLPAEEVAPFFARNKAREVFSRNPNATVLGADTVVAFEGEILGKPKDTEEAKSTLRKLSGKTHFVYTGVCLVREGVERVAVEKTAVKFYPLSEQVIEEYVASGLPLDKAGSYGIQDGYPLVEAFTGSYSNVVGLPVELLSKLLKEEGLC